MNHQILHSVRPLPMRVANHNQTIVRQPVIGISANHNQTVVGPFIGSDLNHNQTMVRRPGLAFNHNQTLIRR